MRDLLCTHIQQEGLGADVRIEAERKLKALEADLVVAERANKERALATRYHKVKFFGTYCTSYLFWRILKRGSDRQKLLRKIRQTKKQLHDEKTSSKVRKALKAELSDLRVDLNYVMVRFSNAMLCSWLFYKCLLPELPEIGEVHLTLPS